MIWLLAEGVLWILSALRLVIHRHLLNASVKFGSDFKPRLGHPCSWWGVFPVLSSMLDAISQRTARVAEADRVSEMTTLFPPVLFEKRGQIRRGCRKCQIPSRVRVLSAGDTHPPISCTLRPAPRVSPRGAHTAPRADARNPTSRNVEVGCVKREWKGGFTPRPRPRKTPRRHRCQLLAPRCRPRPLRLAQGAPLPLAQQR